MQQLSLKPLKTKEGWLSPDVLTMLKEAFDLDSFVETGTYQGATTAQAASVFGAVHTIELDDTLYKNAVARFRTTPHVTVHHGDSATALPAVLSKLSGRCLLWLDGHYSGPGTAKGAGNSPIVDELHAVKNSPLKEVVLLIDDIRLFCGATDPHHPSYGYPSLSQTILLLKELFPGHVACVYADAILAFPASPDVEVSDVIRASTISRLDCEREYPIDLVLESDFAIAKADGPEAEAIQGIAAAFAPDPFSHAGVYSFWYALILLARGQAADAAVYFVRALEGGMRSWRIGVYLMRAALNSGNRDLHTTGEQIAAELNPDYAGELGRFEQFPSLPNVAVNPVQRRFEEDLKKFMELSEKSAPRFPKGSLSLYPCLTEHTENTEFDTHYIYHPGWAARKLAAARPKRHVDFSSSIYFIAIASAIVPIEFYDIRPAQIRLSGISYGEADLTALPFENGALESVSCMHVVEHIGLGRYGDELDPDGDVKAICELQRVTASGGTILFVVPIGKPAIMFNAHRVYSYRQIVTLFSECALKEFFLVPEGPSSLVVPIVNATETQSDSQTYACGCFEFVKR